MRQARAGEFEEEGREGTVDLRLPKQSLTNRNRGAAV